MISKNGGLCGLCKLLLASTALLQQVSLQVEGFQLLPSSSDLAVAPQREHASHRSSHREAKHGHFGSERGLLAAKALQSTASDPSDDTLTKKSIALLCVAVLFGIILGCFIVCCCCVDQEELLREFKQKLKERGYRAQLADVSAKPLDEKQQKLWRVGTRVNTASSADSPTPSESMTDLLRHNTSRSEGLTSSSSSKVIVTESESAPKSTSSLLLRKIGQKCCPDPAMQVKKKERLYNKEGVESNTQDFAWLNFLLSTMWSRIDIFAAQKINDQVGEALHRALPQFKGMISIHGLSLGTTAPKLGPIRVRDHDVRTSRGGIEHSTVLDCKFEIDTPQTISITAIGVGLGIDHVRLEGMLTIALRHPQDKPPFFGGVQLYFINPPSLDVNFTGMTSIPGLKPLIESCILNLLEKELMLPRCVGIDLNKDDDLDDADIKFPEPLGAIGLQLISASDLMAADYNYTSEASSDPFIVIKIGMTEWTSPIVYNSLNPTWPENTMAEFLIYDSKQEITLTAYDHDNITANDLLGKAENIAVDPLMEGTNGGTVMKAAIPLTLEGQSAGVVNVKARWFTLSNSPPSGIAAEIINAGPSQITLEVKLLTLRGLPESASPPFYVRVAAEGVAEKTTKKSRPEKLKLIGGEVFKIIKRMHEEGIGREQISRSLGLHPTEVESALAAGTDLEGSKEMTWNANTLRRVTHPKIDEVVFLLLPWRDGVQLPQVTLELQNKWQSPIGEAVLLPLVEAVARPGTEIGGPFDFGSGIVVNGSICAKYLNLPKNSSRSRSKLF